MRQVAETGGLLTVFLVLRAFASGCTALTGVEAVSNGVPGFEPPKSRNAATTLLLMGAAGDDDVRRHHRARRSLARAHGRGPLGADRLPRRDPAHRAEPDRAGDLRRWRDVLPPPGLHRRDPDPGRQHRLQRLPGAVVAAGARRLPAAPARPARRPARLLQRHRAARGRGLRADRGLQRRGHPPDPALHPRRVPVLHAQPVRHGQALGQRARVRGLAPPERRRIRRKQALNATGAAGHGDRLRDRAAHQVRPGRVDRGGRGADPVLRDEGDRRALPAPQRGGSSRPPSGVALPSSVHAVVLVSNLLTPTLRALAFAQATAPATLRAVKVSAEDVDDPLRANGSSAASRSRWW